jgi:hypothetical protein
VCPCRNPLTQRCTHSPTPCLHSKVQSTHRAPCSMRSVRVCMRVQVVRAAHMSTGVASACRLCRMSCCYVSGFSGYVTLTQTLLLGRVHGHTSVPLWICIITHLYLFISPYRV